MMCYVLDFFSLGSFGKDKTVACVKDIVIDNILMQNTMYGARIKSWQVKKTLKAVMLLSNTYLKKENQVTI